MIRKLKKLGNSQAVILEKPILELIGLEPEGEVQIVVSGSSVVITPVRVGLPDEDIDSHLDALEPRYDRMLSNLAK